MDEEMGSTQGVHTARSGLALVLHAVHLLGLAAWLGLLSGFAELAAFLLVQTRSGEVWSYFRKIYSYPWMIPLVDLTIVVLVALPFALAMLVVQPRLVWNVAVHLLLAVAIMPTLMILGPSLYAWAVALLALGIASVVISIVRDQVPMLVRVIRVSLPVLCIGLLGLVAWRASPADGPGPPPTEGMRRNVLFIVLDTVRGDHLSTPVGRSDRDTSPRIAAFARSGAAFSEARVTAPWTLPTHATLMTGRWEYEVIRGRYGPLEPEVSTLAEVFTREGFDTVGMVANLYFCPYFTGLNRGFSHYEDIPLTLSTALSSTVLGSRMVEAFGGIESIITGGPPRTFPRLPRIDGRNITDRFVHWIDERSEPDRPFFAFLNYFDAHDPYIVPEGSPHRFGDPPKSLEERTFFDEWWFAPDKPRLPEPQLARAVDGYDSCIFALDAQVGRLLDALDTRGLLDETVVVITSDHGEAFGEHGLFGHGGSLYEDQLHVPLVIVSPGTIPGETRIDRAVSLRDLPATILDLAGVSGSPLPGHSLAALWNAEPSDVPERVSPSIASVGVADKFNSNQSRSPNFSGPMTAIVGEDMLKYIRIRTEDGHREECYDLIDDPGELRNLATPENEGRIAPLREALDAVLDRSEAARREGLR